MQISDWLTLGPLVFNGLLAVSNLIEGNYGKALYWFGAFVLVIGVFKMEG